MGVLMAADECCTQCCLGGLVVVTGVVGAGAIAVAVVLEIVFCPVTIPIHIVRRKRVNEGTARFLEGLSKEDREFFMKEFGKKPEDTLSYKHIRAYSKLLEEKLQDKKQRTKTLQRKMEVLPRYYKRNIVWVSVPSVDEVAADWVQFLSQIKLLKEAALPITNTMLPTRDPICNVESIIALLEDEDNQRSM